MTLASGTRVGLYEIVELLGSGGMGEVYRAKDMTLGREVALKTLSAALSNDGEYMARFQREATVLASLNHPNIAAIYGLEQNFIVMELVEGLTLDDRAASGRMPLEDVIAIARQIADALEYAHEKGVIHRDLKPANVKITPDGTAKILDFGLAKLSEAAVAMKPAPNASTVIARQSPTMAGVIMGTASYMAPEQAAGKPVDRRADIWSFGVVLWEMLTGQRLFDGETVSHTLADVLRAEIDLKALPSTTPVAVRQLVARCLDRDVKNRLRDIGEARYQLQRPLAADEMPSAKIAAGTPWHPWAVAGVLIVALALASVMLWREMSREPAPLVRLDLDLKDLGSKDTRQTLMALSADGRRLAYMVKDAKGATMIAVRSLEMAEASVLAGTEEGASPFFSPDGEWIGFFAGDKLKKISRHGGTPIVLAEPALDSQGGSWSDDGTIVYCPGPRSGIWQVNAGGGQPKALTVLSKEEKEITHRYPHMFPGGRSMLYVAGTLGGRYDQAHIVEQNIKTGQRKVVYRGGFFPRYLPTSKGEGYLIFIRGGALVAIGWDPAKMETRGQPAVILEDVTSTTTNGSAQFTFSRNGTVLFQPGNSGDLRIVQWLERSGKMTPLLEKAAAYTRISLSPDGKRLAAFGIEGQGVPLWIYEWERGALSKLLIGSSFPLMAWSPDSRHILFSPGGDAPSLDWASADGGTRTPILRAGFLNVLRGVAMSPDGKFLVVAGGTWSEPGDIRIYPVEGAGTDQLKTGNAAPFVRTAGFKMDPVFSPDGHWLAYTSTESDQAEVYVKAFPGPGGRWQISKTGGSHAVWSKKKNELYYLAPDQRIMVVSFTVKGNELMPGQAQRWSDVQIPRTMSNNRMFDLAPDGERFAVLMPPDAAIGDHRIKVTMVQNFFDEVRRRSATAPAQ
jgi:Tol biopolymer transport system component/predicted Ser/Thr protein kinase